MDLPRHLGAVLGLDPGAPALEFEARWHKWGELAAAAAGLRDALDRAGVGEGTGVGILLRNRPAHVAALLGVLTGRRCVVTVNPIQGASRLCAEIAGLRLEALVASAADWEVAGLRDVAREAGSAAVELPEALGAPCARGAGLEAPGAGPHREAMPGTAIEMLTSGTTGPPKRVRLAYAALEASLESAAHYESKRGGSGPALRPGVALLYHPLVHVAGIFRLCEALAAGRRVSLLERFTVEGWRALVVRHRPRFASLVPAALRMVLDAGLPPEDLASLRAVMSGTAPLSPETAEAFEARYGIPVLSVYGATEFAGGAAGWTLRDKQRHGAAKRGSVGRANRGVELRIVEPESGRSLPPGEVGLLEVRSAQLGPGAKWVRTTDLADLDGDGFLFIRGRADDAIVRGGFKIAPGEVAAALERHPAVREAAVVGLPDARLGSVPVAAVELEPGASADEPELLAFAREQLTGYQVPTRIRVVDDLPRTPSLKVSQPAVRALFEQEPEAGERTRPEA